MLNEPVFANKRKTNKNKHMKPIRGSNANTVAFQVGPLEIEVERQQSEKEKHKTSINSSRVGTAAKQDLTDAPPSIPRVGAKR